MRRREAVEIFKEICECIPEASLSSVFLTNRDTLFEFVGENYELRLNVSLDEKFLRKINSIVKKRNMIMERKDETLLVYAPEIAPSKIPLEIVI